MMVPDNVIIATLLVILNVLELIQLIERRRRYWVHPMNRSRDETSVRNREDVLQVYPERILSYFRMRDWQDGLITRIKQCLPFFS